MAKPQLQSLTQHTEKGVIVLTFTEPTLNADAMAEALSVIDASKTRKVILDCQSVRFLVGGILCPDQEPFTLLLKLSKQLTNGGGRLVLCNLVPEIYEVFRITQFHQFFEIQPDVESAVACLTS